MLDFIKNVQSSHTFTIAVDTKCCATESFFSINVEPAQESLQISALLSSIPNSVPLTLNAGNKYEIQVLIEYNGDINADDANLTVELTGCITKSANPIPIVFKDSDDLADIQIEPPLFFCSNTWNETTLQIFGELGQESNLSAVADGFEFSFPKMFVLDVVPKSIPLRYKTPSNNPNEEINFELSIGNSTIQKSFIFDKAEPTDVTLEAEENPLVVSNPENLNEIPFLNTYDVKIRDVVFEPAYFLSAEWNMDRLIVEPNPLLTSGETAINLFAQDLCGGNEKEIELIINFLCGFGEDQFSPCFNPESIQLMEGKRSIFNIELSYVEDEYFCCDETKKTPPEIEVSLETPDNNITLTESQSCDNNYKLSYNGNASDNNNISIISTYCDGLIREDNIPIQVTPLDTEECLELEGVELLKIDNETIRIQWADLQPGRSAIKIKYYPVNNPDNLRIENIDVRNVTNTDLTGLIPNTRYTILIQQNCADEHAIEQYFQLDLATETTASNCEQIQELTVESVSQTSIDLSWLYDGNVTVAFAPTNTPRDAISETTDAGQITAQNLTPDVEYRFVLQPDCPESADLTLIVRTEGLVCQRPTGFNSIYNTTTNSIEYNWSPVQGATGYVFSVKRDDDLEWGLGIFLPGENNTNNQLSNLIGSGRYDARVAAVCAGNSQSDYAFVSIEANI